MPATKCPPGHLQAAIINADISNCKTRIHWKIFEMQLKGKTLNASSIKELFTSKRDLNNFFDFVNQYREDLKHKRGEGTLENYRKFTDKLVKYHKSRNLSFEQIDISYLQKYENYLRDNGDSPNYIHANWTYLRTMFNAAIKKGIINTYPFKNYDNPVYIAKGKDYLSLKELDQWEIFADSSTGTIQETAIWFLLGCYSGLRISDWYQFDFKKHIQGKNLRLRATKNNEWIVMPISKRLANNLERMKKVPLKTDEPVLNRNLKTIAKKLSIEKHISTHCARHTFAITMCAEQGISSETCAEVMGITVKTCVENYYAVTNKKIAKECLTAWNAI